MSNESSGVLSHLKWVIPILMAYSFFQILLSDYIVDDAFIHLTFARNFASGNGFAFNPGEPTYGITAPLWTLLLAGFSLLGITGPVFVKFLSIVFGILSLPLVWQLSRTLGLNNRNAIAVTIIWMFNVWHIRWAASGMETTMAVALLLLSIKAQLKKQSISYIWLALGTLSRPEILLFLPLFVIDDLTRKSVINIIRKTGLFLLIMLPWQIFVKINFGTLIPNTALVKGDLTIPAFNDMLSSAVRTVKIILASNGIEIILILISIIVITRIRFKNLPGKREIIILVCWIVLPMLFYISKGVFVTSRYLLICIPPLTLLAFMFLNSVLSFAGVLKRNSIITIVTLLMILQQVGLTAAVTLPHAASFRPTITALKDIAVYLQENAPDGSVVAIGDVGVMGYYSNCYVLDLEGLVSHQVLTYRAGKTIDEFIESGDYLKAAQVDYLVDKSQSPKRWEELRKMRYNVIKVHEVPGGLVDSAGEIWYYTLYKLDGQYRNDNGVESWAD